jgi:hypothetical protein
MPVHQSVAASLQVLLGRDYFITLLYDVMLSPHPV